MNVITKLKRLVKRINCDHDYKYTYSRIGDTYIIIKTCSKCRKVTKSKGEDLYE